MKFVNENTVDQCFHTCPFFSVGSDGMECNHQYFVDKEPYANMIITQNNSRGQVPKECPLRGEATEVVLRVKLS